MHVDALSGFMPIYALLMLYIALFNGLTWAAVSLFGNAAGWKERCIYTSLTLIPVLPALYWTFHPYTLHQVWYNANEWLHVSSGRISAVGCFIFGSMIIGLVSPLVTVINVTYLVTVVRRRENRQKLETIRTYTMRWPSLG